jgi:glycerate 2-kinase
MSGCGGLENPTSGSGRFEHSMTRGDASDRRGDLRRIFAAAIAAVDPERLVERALRPGPAGVEVEAPPGGMSLPGAVVLCGSVGVFGAGKAAAPMAASFERHCVGRLDLAGTVISPSPAAASTGSRIRVLAGEHPLPGRLSEASTARLLESLAAQVRKPVDQFVCLLSGGASSLLVAPIPPLKLAEKREVARLLLEGGAAVDEINSVRKHLSTVKGGRILRLVGGRPVVSLILSDVVGDDPATIGSGPAVADRTTYAQALEVLRRCRVDRDCPAAALAVLERGCRGEIPETVRPGSPEARLAFPVVIGSNATARAAAAAQAAALGYVVQSRSEPLTGDTVDCAREWFRSLLRENVGDRPVCRIAGGETTVRVLGGGKGGRNQEFALALVDLIGGRDATVLSAGTDGIDGPTEAAGAFVDGSTLERAARSGLDAAAHLRDNDSFSFFERLGDLLVTGPTGTNVMDLKIALFGPPSAP